MQTDTLLRLLRFFLALIFIWFGMLKLFPGLSPAESLAVLTIDKLFFTLIPHAISLKLLAVWELFIGVGFLTQRFFKVTMGLFLVHMVLTFSPFVLLPALCFSDAPFVFTLVGQYIVKNLVLITAGLLVYNNYIGRRES